MSVRQRSEQRLGGGAAPDAPTTGWTRDPDAVPEYLTVRPSPRPERFEELFADQLDALALAFGDTASLMERVDGVTRGRIVLPDSRSRGGYRFPTGAELDAEVRQTIVDVDAEVPAQLEQKWNEANTLIRVVQDEVLDRSGLYVQFAAFLSNLVADGPPPDALFDRATAARSALTHALDPESHPEEERYGLPHLRAVLDAAGEAYTEVNNLVVAANAYRDGLQSAAGGIVQVLAITSSVCLSVAGGLDAAAAFFGVPQREAASTLAEAVANASADLVSTAAADAFNVAMDATLSALAYNMRRLAAVLSADAEARRRLEAVAAERRRALIILLMLAFAAHLASQVRWRRGSTERHRTL